MLKGVYLVNRVSNVYGWLIIILRYQYVRAYSTVIVKRVLSIASIVSHFSINYLRLSYVLCYTERLAFRKLVMI